MFTKKPKPLPLTQSKNYFFLVSSDKISSNIKKNLPIKIFKLLGALKTPPKIFMVRKLDLVCKKYDVLLNTCLI